MREIVVSGYYGFGNAGDEAMLAAMIEVLTEMDSDCRITVLSGNPDDTRRRHGVAAIDRMNYAELVRVLRRSDLLISGGGSLLQDVTSERSLYYYLSVILLAKLVGTPVMLYAQGIGPVRGLLARAVMRFLGNRVDLITVRDQGSCRELERLAITRPPVEVTADPVMAMHAVDRQIGRRILHQHGLEGGKPLVGISVREWRDWQPYKQAIAAAVDQMVETLGVRVVFIPMQWPEDYAVSQKIAAACRQPVTVLQQEYLTGELLSLVGNLDVLIGIRLHALIFAAVMQVPRVGISYDPKIDRFLETLGGTPCGRLEDIEADKLVQAVAQALTDKKQGGAAADSIRSLRQKSLRNAELALELIAKAGRCGGV